ncbi:site-2 protease family protein [Anaerovorax odorimutans]|uniref:site-2 protease family protein n=1 Tax=Anaerovorax odorimutans TaxID=109327 RepID=UPI0012EB11FB|nr:site-2 protease family protein [Anaerovorax odorimutans]
MCSIIFSFLHELVHGKAAKCLGYTPEKISMGLFGGILHVREEFIKPKHEIIIHLCGPLFNIAVATLFYIITNYYIFMRIDFIRNLFVSILIANLILGIFNLMPFYPLDGGKIIKLYFAFFLGYGRAEKISRSFSLLFVFLLFILGIYLLQYNLFNIIICALAINLYIARRQENSFIFYKVSKDIESGIISNKSKIVVCKENFPAMKVIETYKPLERRLFTIVNDKGSYKGQLSEEELLQGIYDCGVYADFNKLLKSKKKRNGENHS